MKKILITLVTSTILLSSCSDYIENIEVTTLNTGITVNGKKMDAPETASEKSEETSADKVENSETPSSEGKSENKFADSSKTGNAETSTKDKLGEKTANEINESITDKPKESEEKAEKKDFLADIQNVPISDLVENTESTSERIRRSEDADDVDIDFTMLNSTMLYSQLYNIIMNANEYLGQKMRIEGIYIKDVIDTEGNAYHFVVVLDETACCQQGMEFRLDDGLAYPEAGDTILLKGQFLKYDEEGQEWYYLQASSIE